MITAVAKAFGINNVFGKKEAVVCDAVEGLDFTFEPARYMGDWYEIYHSSGEPFQPNSWTCN